MTKDAKHSYGHILKSSALIGVSSLLDIALRVVRVKVTALLLGPAGVGLMGLFGSIADLALSLFVMGVDNSGVRQIAQATGSGDRERIVLTVRVLKRVCLILAIAGAALLALFSRQISQMTFGSDDHVRGVALLSLAVYFRLLFAGQAALLRGTRRIADLARMEVIGAIFATLTSVPLIYFLHEDGVVPSLVVSAAGMTLSSWWYARKVALPPLDPAGPSVLDEVWALLRLGFAFMVTGLVTMGAAYAVRVIVLRQLGVDAAGLYQSAWTIGGLYVGFILQAMGTDFYPRLTAVSADASESSRMVNEQVFVSLLMAGPGVLATLTLAPFVVALFYSGKFDGAVGALRWICLGMSLRVITWPLGFIVVAKGLKSLFVAVDLACAIVQVALAWLLVKTVGLDGAGMAFFGLYIFHGLIIYPIARRLTGFRWSAENKRLASVFVPVIALVFGSFYVLPRPWATVLGALALLVTSAGSLRILVTLIPPASMPVPVRRLLERGRVLAPRGTE